MALQVGMKVGFFSGDILKLTEDMGILKPTFFPSVPRLYNRIYGKI
jgi:long-chain acyl-CoA synthetase